MSPTEVGVARAAALFERVDPVKAAALLESVLAADPATAAGLVLTSRIRLVLDQVDRALEAGQGDRAGPRRPAPAGRGEPGAHPAGRHEEAITTAYRAVIADPGNPLWHDRVAWSLIAADRQLADAEQAARTAVGLNPNEAHYYFTHGVTLDALGHADQARQALLISLRLEPENPVAQHRLAVLNGESVRPPEKKRRGWRMFGRCSTDGGKPVRPEASSVAILPDLGSLEALLGSGFGVRALFPRVRLGERPSRVDERHVAERLREVADAGGRARVVLLGQQPDIVAQRQQPLEQLARLVAAADQREVVGQPERARRNAPSPGGSPSTPSRRRSCSAARSRRSSSSRSIASTVPRTRGSSARQEADQRDHQQARVELARAVVLGERACAPRRSPASQTSAWISSRSARQRSTGPSRPNSSTALTARSNATHAITFECVKCRRGAAHLPDALVRAASQPLSRKLEQRALQRPGAASSRSGAAAAGAWCSASMHLAVDVELELLGRRRCRSAPAPSPRSRAATSSLELGQPALAGRRRT